MKRKIINVILSGGTGTRLWPLSREKKPKQFLQFFQNKSLFQHTILRNYNLVDDYTLITNSSQIKHAEIQVEELKISISNNIIEPIGRNTAPAIALAALSMKKEDVMIVTPSDHMIGIEDDEYETSMKRAIILAEEGNIVTFGIKPTSPNIGFGYIEHEHEDVVSFREKPNKITAKLFCEKGNFSWNSGMFCFKASVFLSELNRYNPEMYFACLEAFKSMNSKGEIDRDLMLSIPSDSIDYALLEKSDKIKIVPSNFYWTDLGTYDSLIDYYKLNKEVQNLSNISKNTYSFSNKRVVTNLENIIIVDSEDVILIMERNKTDVIKSLYKKTINFSEHLK